MPPLGKERSGYGELKALGQECLAGSTPPGGQDGWPRVRVPGRGEPGAPHHWKDFDIYSVLRNSGGF